MVGIAVSKETLTCAVLSAADRRLCGEVTVPNTAQGIAQLLRRPPPRDAWVVEPTGVYSRRVVQQADAAGRQVWLAQPKRAKAFLASVQPRAKTDRLDSRGSASAVRCVTPSSEGRSRGLGFSDGEHAYALYHTM